MTPFPALLNMLSEGRVDFVLVGGVAAIAHGSARLTQDVDIVYSRADANLERLVAAVRPHAPYVRGAPPGLPFDWSAATVRAGLNFTLITELGPLDLLGEITGGGSYEDLVPHSAKLDVFGHDTLVLDLPWLIKVKRAAGRPKDLEVLAELEALEEEQRRL